METLPPVTLGAILFVSFLLIFILRRPMERFWVLSAEEAAQPRRQFFLDLALCLLAGWAAYAYNAAAFGFPISSGLTLVLGCAVVGFFLALDMALLREQGNIVAALSKAESKGPPERLYSMIRRFSLVALTTVLFVAVVIVMVISRDIVWLAGVEKTPETFAAATLSIAYEVLFIMAVLLLYVINLILSYAKNINLLFKNETGVLERVSRGDLTQMVPVATRDEFGVIAGHTNTMIHGLKHRIQLISALKLAEEVQQNLLPRRPPRAAGLDIAGTSIYCDETGGDYFDYFNLPAGRLGIVVADVSDHGVGAALHMTTARAFVYAGIRKYAGPAQMLHEINGFLARDTARTGYFMTMLFLEIETAAKSLRWVRAGHEPALLFDPAGQEFQTLAGDGLALGVEPDFLFVESVHRGWTPGSILFAGTDGINETRNRQGEMYGFDRLRDVIRTHADKPAEDIKQAVIASLRAFRGDACQEDDITLIIVKLA